MDGKVAGHKRSQLHFLVLSHGDVKHGEQVFFTVKVSPDPVLQQSGVISQIQGKTKVWYTTTTPIFMTKSMLEKLEVIDEIETKIIQGLLAEKWLIEKAIQCLYLYLGPTLGPVHGMEKYTLAFNLAAQKFLSSY